MDGAAPPEQVRRPARRQARRIWLAVHLWTGLGLGGLFALLGLTGSVLVFYLDIDAAFNPAIRAAHAVAAPVSADAVHHRLRQAFPGRDGPWRIEMPLSPDSPVTARYYRPAERAGRSFAPLMVTLDPETLAVTSSRFWGDTAMTWIYDLHYSLLLDRAGVTLVGIAGLLAMVSLATGLYLWWPSRARFAAALRPVPRAGAVRRNYDLHVIGGVYGLIVLAVVTLAGSALALPETARSLVSAFSAPSPPPRLPAVPPLEESPPLSLDAAVALAGQRFPGAEVRWIETSGAGGTPVSVRLHQAFEPGRRFPRTQVWFHPATGAVLAIRDPAGNGGGDTVFDWLHPLHNGEAFGTAGRVLACIAGFLPLLLFVTGVIRWRQKVRAREKSRTARPALERRVRPEHPGCARP
ncbi:PepSY-associated TM helix domain-containing protein [Thauera sinica]|uniref:PepSY-associated TM helix domain-containing protein n=1 Tax=Thauera sinica TaxID=2665146 RepID=A0ABW1AP25_9RHOO|nr:PepSY-associated TM helix domain-containing protein [Thauera sp. K11]